MNANAKSMTATYDYLAARMAEDTLVDPFTDVHIWGEDEHAAILFFGADGYSTERTVARTQGVWVYNRGGGTIDFFTSDDGVQVTPPATVNVTFSGLKDDTEVRVYDMTAPIPVELAGVENATDGSPDDRSATFALTAGLVVDVRFAHDDTPGDAWIVPPSNSITDFTWPSTTTDLPITQVFDRSFDNPV
jgi:hypothetical protein